jgi:hypothetical protein
LSGTSQPHQGPGWGKLYTDYTFLGEQVVLDFVSIIQVCDEEEYDGYPLDLLNYKSTSPAYMIFLVDLLYRTCLVAEDCLMI